MVTLVDHTKLAAEARSNLNMFYAIIALTENGLFRGCHGSLSKIQKICRSEAAKMLEAYDTHVHLSKSSKEGE